MPTPPQTPVEDEATPWMTLEEVQARLRRADRQTILRYVAEGLPAYQPGGPRSPHLFHRDEVDAWMKARIKSKCSSPDPDEPIDEAA